MSARVPQREVRVVCGVHRLADFEDRVVVRLKENRLAVEHEATEVARQPVDLFVELHLHHPERFRVDQVLLQVELTGARLSSVGSAIHRLEPLLVLSFLALIHYIDLY